MQGSGLKNRRILTLGEICKMRYSTQQGEGGFLFGTIMLDIALQFLVAAALGGLIGLERGAQGSRQRKKKKKRMPVIGGIRTFSILSMLGALSMYLSQQSSPGIFLMTFFFVVALTSIEYYLSFRNYKALGITTELSLIISFLIGALVLVNRPFAIIFAIFFAYLLSQKRYLENITDNISSQELYSTIKFAIVAFAVLPLLPDQAYDPWNILNPYNIWFIVVLISSLSFIGYVLTKVIGHRYGLLLLGFVGGLFSSTAVTITMGHYSKKMSDPSAPALSVLIASTMMFIRALFVVYILNADLALSILMPLGFMIVTSFVISSTVFFQRFYKKFRADGRYEHEEAVTLESPFTLKPAFKFCFFFIFVLFLVEFTRRTIGDAGTYATSIISGIADVDAISVSLAKLAAQGDLIKHVATQGITFAVMTNTIVKLFYARQFGSSAFAKKIAQSFAFVIIAGIAALFLPAFL